jgi:replication initiation and membrane attachment protein DnaB
METRVRHLYRISFTFNVYNFVVNFSQVEELKRDCERLSKEYIEKIENHWQHLAETHAELLTSSCAAELLNNRLQVSTWLHVLGFSSRLW